MITRVLCWLGFHDWHHVYSAHETAPYGFVCPRCAEGRWVTLEREA